MDTQIDICQQTQMIKSIQTKKMDVSILPILQKKNQLADGIYLGFMFQKNPEDYDLIISDIIGTNKKLNKGEISYQEKINYYNVVMNNEVKKEKVLKYIYYQEEQIRKQQVLSQSQILQDNMRSQIKSLIQQPLQFQGDCKICLGQLSQHQSYRLAQCQHVFHKECLILHGKNWQALPVLCPQEKCKTEIMQHDLNEICDKQTKIRLAENSFKLYLQRTRDIYTCPTPDCQGVFVVDVNCLQKMATFYCSICQLSYCPRCKKAPHQGVCQQGSMIQVVNNKMYRRCNKCGMMIEKDGGCNHIVCICQNEFCYGCGKEWINREQFYCFCESELEMKIARMLGLQQREFKEPEKPAQNLEQRIAREINYALDGLLINVTRLIGRAHRRHLARKQQQQQKN